MMKIDKLPRPKRPWYSRLSGSTSLFTASLRPRSAGSSRSLNKILKSLTNVLFYLIFFLTPLIFFPKSSEIFELNKTVFVYALTVLIIFTWMTRSIIHKKLILRRTILDIPLILFIITQSVSTVLSIHPKTSLLGYYSRFNGGLISSVVYSLLYWAFVSNMAKKSLLKSIKLLIISTIIVSFIGILEHFGKDATCIVVGVTNVELVKLFSDFSNFLSSNFNTNCWTQDVASRVFSTLGQPNWLAALIASTAPLAWGISLIKSKSKNKSYLFAITIAVTSIFYLTTLYTGSRSGVIGFMVSYILFFALGLKIHREKFLRLFIAVTTTLTLITFLVGTPWTRGLINQIGQNQISNIATDVRESDTAQIRKLVWQGAIDIWRDNPFFGSGPETFAYTYFQYRPKIHNLTSEWEFLYNKAHNEYLNYLANTGLIGLLVYLIVIFSSIVQILQIKNLKLKIKNYSSSFVKFKSIPINQGILVIGILSGYISILVTNFFGFSTTTTSLLFFLFPAMAVVLNKKEARVKKSFRKLNFLQYLLVSLLILTTYYLLLTTYNFYRADLVFAKGRTENRYENFDRSIDLINLAIDLNPTEESFWIELADSYAEGALDSDDEVLIKTYVDNAIEAASVAIRLNPNHIRIKTKLANIYIKLSIINPKYLNAAESVLEDATKIAPSDAKIHYNLSLVQSRLGKTEDAISTAQKTINLKIDHEDARFLLALLLIETNDTESAQEHLNYILENINPESLRTKQKLEELKGN